MAHLKLCPYCGGTHRKRSAFLRCKRKHKPEMWEYEKGKSKRKV